MGYYCVLIQVRERTLMDMNKDHVPHLFQQAGSPARRRTSLRVLEQYERPGMEGEPVPPISLEKMWLALHHLLTGGFNLTPSPLSRAILGGTPIGPDLGEGPARYLWADEVREIATALSALTSDDLRRRHRPADLKAGWPTTPVSEDEDDEEVFTELEACFRLLGTFYRIAVARGNAILIGVV
jgi:hypothetical protein